MELKWDPRLVALEGPVQLVALEGPVQSITGTGSFGKSPLSATPSMVGSPRAQKCSIAKLVVLESHHFLQLDLLAATLKAKNQHRSIYIRQTMSIIIAMFPKFKFFQEQSIALIL